jgi:hypothetical protein
MKNLTVLKAGIDEGYEVRQEGEHLVVPVVMMVEGVHHGNHGPLLYSAEELGRKVDDWENTPIVVNHPQNEAGAYISANSPEVSANQIVGRVHNVRMDGDKLRGDAYLAPDLLEIESPQALDRINNSNPMEVSIGVGSEDIQTEGEWNGEHYIGITKNHIPDHLALLPNTTGACSYDKGCGIRNNENQLSIKKEMNEEKLSIEKRNVVLTLNGQSTPLLDSSELFNNEMGFREIGQNIQQQLNAMDTNSNHHYLEEVFDGFFVYQVSGSTPPNQYYKRDYQVVNGAVTFGETLDAVERKVTFDVIANQKARPKLERGNKSVNNSKTEGGEQMEKQKASPCKVSALIANEATNYIEADREWLSELDDVQLDKMIPKEVEPVVNEKIVETPVTAEQIKAVLNEEKDPTKFIDTFMPEGMRESVKAGIKMNEEKRATLIEGIVANSKFEKETLEGWDTAQLETLHQSVVKTEVNYVANGSGSPSAAPVDNGMSEMLNLKTEEK